MKTIEQLKEGKCTVITDHGEFSGSYSDEYNCVFFAIPAHYEILGYIQ